MALTLIATAGAASANSFATVAEALAVADGLYPPPTGFQDQDPATQAATLVTATAHLNRLSWAGARATTTQALAWPRVGVRIPDGVGELDSTTIPAAVQRATALLAFWLAAQDATEEGLELAPGLASLSLGGEVSMSFEPGATSVTPLERVLQQEIRPVLRGLVYATQSRLVRG